MVFRLVSSLQLSFAKLKFYHMLPYELLTLLLKYSIELNLIAYGVVELTDDVRIVKSLQVMVAVVATAVCHLIRTMRRDKKIFFSIISNFSAIRQKNL